MIKSNENIINPNSIGSVSSTKALTQCLFARRSASSLIAAIQYGQLSKLIRGLTNNHCFVDGDGDVAHQLLKHFSRYI